MGRIRTIARRSFLIGSAAVLGGVAFGYYAYKRPLPNPLKDDLAEGEAALTPYVKIDANGITLITPRADFGQGGYSVQAMLLAEELDIDPASVRLDPGKPSPAYYNQALLREAVPFQPTDTGWLAKHARDLTDVPAKFLGFQITGGSSTVPDAFDKLRMAGAVARETLKEAAAQKAGVSRDVLKTGDGAVILPDGTRMPYTALAPVAAGITPVSDVTLRPPESWRLIGKPRQRLDIVAKSTGTQSYGIDFTAPGMLYATVRMNPGIGGAMKSFDAGKAQKMRGVKKIVPLAGGIGVIADNTWRAIQAANEVDIQWEAPAYPASSAAMWDKMNDVLENGSRDHTGRDDGDVEAALAAAEAPLDAQYRVPYLAHAPLEPMSAAALITGQRADIWTGSQIPRFVESHVASLTGLSRENVHVHVLPMGGSFGRRLEDDYVLQAVELAQAMPGTPIKLTWSREEDMTHDFPRPMQMMRARGAHAGGKVVACDLHIAGQSITSSWFSRLLYAPPGPDRIITTGAWDQPYAIPDYRVTGYRAPEMVPVSSWRSVGASGNAFFHECFLDELIAAAGADPLEERLRLCDDPLSRKVLEKLGEISGWNGPTLSDNRARGLAFSLSFGVPAAEVVEIITTADGIRIDKVFAVAEVGRIVDPVNFEAQLSGGALFGLGHAMNCELTFEDHAAEQDNFHVYEAMRLNQAPEVVAVGLENGPHIRGIGEPGVPPAAPALANAIFAATGQRIRELPLARHVDFA